MDKETLSNYGWIVICVLVMVVMIALATPFGSYVSSAVKSTTEGLFDVNKEALNSTGLIDVEDQSISTPYDDVNVPEDNTPDGVGGIIDGVKDFIEDNKDEIKDVVDDAKDFIEDNKDEIKDTIDDVKDKADDKIEEITGGATCGIIEHAHEDACYLKTCDHKNGHISACYETVIGYNLCEHANDTEHTGSVTLADVVTINGTNVTWVKTHPAYSVVYAEYKKAYDEAYASAKYLKDITAKAAGVASLLGKSFCYTAVESTEPTLCTHGECTDTSGTCYTKICVLPEHAHDEVECFKPKN
jgi:gas vesicle protein